MVIISRAHSDKYHVFSVICGSQKGKPESRAVVARSWGGLKRTDKGKLELFIAHGIQELKYHTRPC